MPLQPLSQLSSILLLLVLVLTLLLLLVVAVVVAVVYDDALSSLSLILMLPGGVLRCRAAGSAAVHTFGGVFMVLLIMQ